MTAFEDTSYRVDGGVDGGRPVPGCHQFRQCLRCDHGALRGVFLEQRQQYRFLAWKILVKRGDIDARCVGNMVGGQPIGAHGIELTRRGIENVLESSACAGLGRLTSQREIERLGRRCCAGARLGTAFHGATIARHDRAAPADTVVPGDTFVTSCSRTRMVQAPRRFPRETGQRSGCRPLIRSRRRKHALRRRQAVRDDRNGCPPPHES